MRNSRLRFAVRSSLVAAVTVFGLLLPGTAHAIIQDFDYFKITAPRVDFGNGSLVLGSPNDEAVVLWDLEPLSGDWTSIVDGRVFISNFPGGCVRLEVEWTTIYGWEHWQPSGQICAGDGGTHYFDVTMDYTYPAEFTQVRIDLKRANSINAVWVTAASSTQYPPA
jgi:hypothetical protein